jgi:hypothetical protein
MTFSRPKSAPTDMFSLPWRERSVELRISAWSSISMTMVRMSPRARAPVAEQAVRARSSEERGLLVGEARGLGRRHGDRRALGVTISRGSTSCPVVVIGGARPRWSSRPAQARDGEGGGDQEARSVSLSHLDHAGAADEAGDDLPRVEIHHPHELAGAGAVERPALGGDVERALA